MRTHTKTFHIRFTETEYERLCKYAEKAGLPKSTYIRHMINGCRPKEHPPMDFWEFKKALYASGNNLNQLVALAHRFGSFHEKKLEDMRKQFTDLILLISKRMIAPDPLDVPETLKRGRLLAEKEQEERRDERE